MRGLSEERLTWHLENWEYQQRNKASDYGEGFNHRDGSGACSTSSQEFDTMVETADKQVAGIVDAAVHDLPEAQRKAVLHFHGLAVFRLARQDIDLAYNRARTYLKVDLVERGIAW
jgi:hypothetical protein